jgi:hypothetical protein
VLTPVVKPTFYHEGAYYPRFVNAEEVNPSAAVACAALRPKGFVGRKFLTQSAKAQRKPLETRQRFAPLRQNLSAYTYFLCKASKD